MPRIPLPAVLVVSVALSVFVGEPTEAQQLAPSHPPVTSAPASTSRPAPTEVARVNGVPLTSDRLDAALSQLLPQESFHQTVNGAALVELRKKALQQLIDDELVYQDGQRLSIRIPAADVQTALAATVKRYGGPVGFGQVLARAGVTEATVRREVRRALLIERTRTRRVTDACHVTPADVERFYREHPERFAEPEQLHVFAITLGVDPSTGQAKWSATRAEAEALRARLVAGASFADAARERSTDPSGAKGGDMGFVHRGSLTPAFESVLKDLPVGTTSAVIETLYGYHIVRVSEVRPARHMRFAEARARLTTDLREQRCQETSDAWMARLRAAATVVIGG